MANDIDIKLSGFVATELELKKSRNGVDWTQFRLAHSYGRYDKEKNSWVEGSTTWFSVIGFGNLALNMVKSIAKGDIVIVEGAFKEDVWEKDGVERRGLSIEVKSIGHDLKRGTSKFERNSHATVFASQTQEAQTDAAAAAAEAQAEGTSQPEFAQPLAA